MNEFRKISTIANPLSIGFELNVFKHFMLLSRPQLFKDWRTGQNQWINVVSMIDPVDSVIRLLNNPGQVFLWIPKLKE